MQYPNVIAQSRLKNLINWIQRPYAFLDECIQAYGDTFTIRFMGFQPLVLFGKPQAVKDIFTLDTQQFEVNKGQGVLRPLVGDNSLFLIDGDHHKRDRKLLMPPFHGSKVKAYGETICHITREICEPWQPQQTVLIRQIMPKITLEVILQTVFGLKDGDRYRQLKPLLISLLSLTGSPLSSSLLFFKWLQKDWGGWSPWGKFVRQRQQVYDLLQAEIESRRAQPTIDSTDVLSLMLSARDEDGQPMTDMELKDELITMLLAGYETTASVLSWALYWIHKLPDVKAKLMAELNGLDDTSNVMAIAKLPYLTAVASEAMRLYPIVPITSPRVTTQTVVIDGQSFPPNTFLTPCIYTIHHREDLYPDSKTFRPERFIERQFSSSEFLPFGGGNRRCLGYALAKLEANLVLATILTCHSFKLANEQPVKPSRRGVVIATSNDVPLVVEA